MTPLPPSNSCTDRLTHVWYSSAIVRCRSDGPLDVLIAVCFRSALFSSERGRTHSTKLTATPSLAKHCLSACLSVVRTKWPAGPSTAAEMHCLFMSVSKEPQKEVLPLDFSCYFKNALVLFSFS